MPYYVEYSCDVAHDGSMIIDVDGINTVEDAEEEAFNQVLDEYDDQAHNIKIEYVKEIKKEEVNNYDR